MQFMTLLILVFAFAIGYATFIENDFGRSTAKSLVFSAWWFELVLILLVFNLVNNLIKYKLFRLEKIAALTFHVSFIVILIGAGITRYVSHEGMMHIREGDSTDLFLSDDTFLQIHIDDRVHQYKYNKKLFLSGISNNNFSLRKLNFKNNDISVESIAFLPNVKDSCFVGLEDGETILKLVVPGENGMQDEFIKYGEQKIIKGQLFTFNNPDTGAINLFLKNDTVECISDYEISSMSMITQEVNQHNSLISFVLNKKTLHTVNGLNFVFKEILSKAKIMPVSSSNVMTDGNEDALVLKVNANGVSKEIVLYGGKGFIGTDNVFAIGDLNFKLNYGSKYYKTPFRLKLRDFQLERYPGSMSPSSYAAEVSILDEGTALDYRIFMNNVLNYKGYRFFQSSYDKDEKGTILSVNHDWWGTLISYIGYFLLSLGFILVFLTKKTRYKFLTEKLRKLSATIILLFIMISSAFADENLSVLNKYKIDANHILNFDALVIQDNGGRLKPVHTQTSEYLRKIYGKSNLDEESATEVILGMMYSPNTWSKRPIIKLSHEKLRRLLSISDMNSRNVRTSFNSFFDENGTYLLSKDVGIAYEKLPKDRDKYDKEVIKVDERVNICFTIYAGGVFRFFPIPNDSNNTWVTRMQSTEFSGNDSLFVVNIMPMYFNGLKEGLETNNWETADTIISYIKKFQLRYGKDVLPEKSKIDLEVMYNKLSVFSRLFIYYSLCGMCLLSLVIINLFYNNKLLITLIQLFKWLIIFGFVVHIFGLALRWYISGHAPWSNGYESMIYIAWATIFSGLIFSKRSTLTLAATAVVSGLLLMVAHLNWLDPEITNLVPVLNSYWLMIHVAIITASYGFFSLASILGLIALWLIIFTNSKNKSKLKNTLSELTIINEKSLEIGLFMLTVGTFLGGVWANESWGRYWGWDPKETWALVSVLVYSFVLHMRFIPLLRDKLTFNIVSMFAIWTIIMTYFGVNYYLSGLHSYAAGDPMPIPSFVYYLSALMIVSAIISKLRFKRFYS